MNLTETFIPKCHGPHKLLASLDCPQLTQVHGFINIVVKEKWTSTQITGRPESFQHAFQVDWFAELHKWYFSYVISSENGKPKGGFNLGILLLNGWFIADMGVIFWNMWCSFTYHMKDCKYSIILVICFLLLCSQPKQLTICGCVPWFIFFL